MNERLQRSGLAFLASALSGLLVAPPARGLAPGTCEALTARIGTLPAAVRRPADGEGLEAWRRRVIGEVEIEAALAAAARARGLDAEPDWRQRFARRREAVLVAALEDSFAAGISVEETEVERRFAESRERFRTPEKIATSLILLHLPPDAPPEAVEAVTRRLLEIRAEHAAGERFGALARRYSEAENAARGGAVKASARGGLLAAYEEVAWSLAPGEVSAPFRLPDGMAIVRLENVFPARELDLESARPGIEKRLEWEKAEARREAALAEARALWPARVDWPAGAAGPAAIHFAGETPTLEDLGLAHRPPRLRSRVSDELDRRRLVRLAEHRRLAERSPTSGLLAALRESTLAAAELERRAVLLVPEPSEAELRALYAEDLRRFPDPERRTFEVYLQPGTEGALRAVRQDAERRAASWREGTPPPALETWGPLVRSEIGASTSPLLAEIAFGLSIGEVSAPVRMERYRAQAARFETEGYVILRLLEVEPASTLPFEAVREQLASYAVRHERARAAGAVRADLAAGLATELDGALERFESCPLTAPPR